jgi:DNA-binding CsgD family transcriptional regulator
MTDRRIVLLALSDRERADRLASTLEADGDFLTTSRVIADGVDVAVRDDDGLLRVSAGAPGEAGEAEATLPRNADDALVIAAIRLVAAGFRIAPVDHAELDPHPVDVEEIPAGRRRPVLSAREIEVLNLLADGAQNKVIARALNISVHTAKFHVASLLTKLGAVNRTDAIAIAMREGLVSM